jgi:hypothetical protein
MDRQAMLANHQHCSILAHTKSRITTRSDHPARRRTSATQSHRGNRRSLEEMGIVTQASTPEFFNQGIDGAQFNMT